MNDISIHDNIVTGYEVSCTARDLVIHTLFQNDELDEKTDLVFGGIEAYHLVGDNMQTILFDVTECPLEQILKDFASEFEVGLQYGWPGPWNESPESCLEHFADQKCKGWTISSSYGMGGFVIAQSMKLQQE